MSQSPSWRVHSCQTSEIPCPVRLLPDIHSCSAPSKTQLSRQSLTGIAKTRVPPAFRAILDFRLHKILSPACGRPALD